MGCRFSIKSFSSTSRATNANEKWRCRYLQYRILLLFTLEALLYGLIICCTFIQYELLKDHKALNTVRELLVIIRIWGLLRPSCLPVFLRSADNLDVLALLFRLLSKLVQPNGETQQQIDDGLIGKFPFG